MTIRATVYGYNFTFDGNRSVKLEQRSSNKAHERKQEERAEYEEMFGIDALNMRDEINRLSRLLFEHERDIMSTIVITEDPTLERIFTPYEQQEET